jgi:prepilin-type N-terminal cleavage/methylation domain-containing protein
MTTPNTQKGFTLVELAIVMTIIGLLIGGILKGQELMENARNVATAAQIKAFSAAVTSFKDMYQATPGDMPLAGTRIAGCPTAASCNPLAASAGNGFVAANTWGSGGWALQGNATVAAAPNNLVNETYLFWSHLLLANLIGGVTVDGLKANTAFQFNVTHPEAKSGGGFVVGYNDGTPGLGGIASTFQAAGTGIVGTVVVLVASPSVAIAQTANTQPLTPLRAAMLDRKVDDGRPATGYVQTYGLPASCWQSAAIQQYLETSSAKDCGLIFRIEG